MFLTLHIFLYDKNFIIKKTTEVYLEAGFEDLSHFSFAFRKKYRLSSNQLLLHTIS